MAFWNRKKDAAAPESSKAGPDRILMHDAQGNQIWVLKEQWRTDMLPNLLQSNWSNPEGLCGVVQGSMEQDGLFKEVEAAAVRLREIDPDHARSATILAVCKLKLGKLDEAERVIREEMTTHGEDGLLLVNLAKIQAERGDQAEAERTLWHGLEVDPNQENGLLWFEVLQRERQGEEAGRAAFAKVAALPGSWLAQVWLARHALDRKDIAEARRLYAPALALPDLPGKALMQISGDLGQRGYLAEAIELVAPRYNANKHGPNTANNLLMAMTELGRKDDARRFLAGLPPAPDPRFAEVRRFWTAKVS